MQLVDVRLGGPGARYALNAYGLTTAELVVRPAESPRGVVRLEHAQVGAFRDSPALWLGRSARGSVLVDGFTYGALNDTRSADARKRLHWFERVSNGYSPALYDQLAAAYQRAGQDEMAETVLIARQHRRYAAAGPAGRIWGALQRWTVGYGYRPWLAVCW